MAENKKPIINRNLQNAVIPRAIKAAREAKIRESQTSAVQFALSVLVMLSGNAIPKPAHDIALGTLFGSILKAGISYQGVTFSKTGFGNAFTTTGLRALDKVY